MHCFHFIVFLAPINTDKLLFRTKGVWSWFFHHNLWSRQSDEFAARPRGSKVHPWASLNCWGEFCPSSVGSPKKYAGKGQSSILHSHPEIVFLYREMLLAVRGTGFSASKCAFWVYIIGDVYVLFNFQLRLVKRCWFRPKISEANILCPMR